MERWEVEARVAIGALHSEYVARVDGEQLDAWAELFTDDAVVRNIYGREIETRPAIRAYIQDVSDSKRDNGITLQHHHTPAFIRFDDRTHADAECYFTARRADATDHWGRYRDRLRLDGSRWRFAFREITIDGSDPSGWVGSGAAARKLRSS
jgi:ketosteroid isomerase-like protein